jgi:hypothetical protein
MLVSQRARFLPPRPRVGKSRPVRRHQGGMTQQHSGVGIGRCLAEREPVDVTTWRRCRLLEAGFEAGLADRLAATAVIDLHVLLQLVDRGCPPALAARILAPLNDPDAPA